MQNSQRIAQGPSGEERDYNDGYFHGASRDFGTGDGVFEAAPGEGDRRRDQLKEVVLYTLIVNFDLEIVYTVHRFHATLPVAPPYFIKLQTL